MRLRNIKGAKEFIEESSYVIQEPSKAKGNWHSLFHNDNPIHIEVGMGKGQFIQTLATMNPNINYIGIEKYASVLLRALEKRPLLKTDNLLFLCINAEDIKEIFDTNEVSQIYLNFSDPWPKDRHFKRRLTSNEFLSRYHSILKPDGKLNFKTDNRKLFDFSVEQIPLSGWKLQSITYDLHHSEYLPGNVMTEYEERFVSLGEPIHYLVAYR